MSRDKETSITDYFKEDPFTHLQEPPTDQETPPSERIADHRPYRDNAPKADEAAIRQYRKALGTFFIRGERTPKSLNGQVDPVLLAPYLRGEHPDLAYPALYDPVASRFTPVRRIIQDTYERLYPKSEARILGQQLHRIEKLIREHLPQEDPAADYPTVIKVAMKELRKLDVHGDEGETFREHCVALEQEMLKHPGTLLGFSAATPFHLLALQLQAREAERTDFVGHIRKLGSQLEELLLLQKAQVENDTDHGQLKHQFGFADQMISFDALADLLPPSASTGLPEARLQRIRGALDTLAEAADYYAKAPAYIYVTEELAKAYALARVMPDIPLTMAGAHPCATANQQFHQHLPNVIRYVSAIRIAELESTGAYVDDLHDPYFETFGLANLSEDDIRRMPAHVVIAERLQLLREPEEFLSLLAGNIPVNVFAVSRLKELERPGQADDEPLFREELADLALTQRNTFVFQGAADLPEPLFNSIRNGLNAAGPAFWNLLLPELDSADPYRDYVYLTTAIESRYFPRLAYNLHTGVQFGSRFDISGNPQPDRLFPSYPVDVREGEQSVSLPVTLTMADYFLLDTDLQEQLEIIPPGLENDDLLPLHDYLTASSEDLLGKLPFLWVVDSHNGLRQAVVPFAWLERCKERLDHWQFIQELGGVNSYHVQRAIEQARADWKADKEMEIQALRMEMEAEIERIRREEAGRAMERLADILLDLDTAVPATATKAAPVAAAPTTDSAPVKVPDAPAAVPEPEPAETSSEVWIESWRCTSCNDCIQLLPSVFKYNGDKQAEVINPKAGTYAKIVTAAEKCPAKCIHPGLPQNPGEPGLDELIKRAAVLN